MRTYRSIRFQLLLLVLAVAVPIIGLVLYSTYKGLQLEAQQARTAALNLAQLTAAHTDQQLADSENFLKQIAQRPLIQAMDPARCDPFLEEFSELFPQYTGLGVVDLSGQTICSGNLAERSALPWVGDRPWFRTVTDRQRFTVSEVVVGRISAIWVSVLAYPIHDASGELVGALSMPIDLVRYQVGAESVALPPDGTISIINGEGTVVARSVRPERWVGQNVRGTEIVDLVLAGGVETAEGQSLEGIEKIYGVTAIPRAGWHVYVGIPSSNAFASFRSMAIQQAALSLVIIALVAVLVVYLVRQIERPVRTLAETAAAVSAGKLESRARMSGPKEFTEVARQFNTMLDVHAQHEAQLARQAQELTMLGEMGQIVASTLDLTLLLNRVLEEVARLIPAEAISILLVEGEELRFAAASGPVAVHMKGQRLPVTAGIAGEVIRSGRPVWLQDTTNREHLFRELEKKIGYYVRALQVVPLKLRGRVIGVVEAVHSRPGAFTQNDLQLLGAAASWAAIAISNAHLFAEVRSAHGRLRQLAQQVVTTQEEERRRLSRELHDEAGQVLTALKINLDLLRAGVPEELAELRQGIAEAAELTDQTMEQIRLLAHNLRPPGLENVGLNATLGGLCRDFASWTQLPIHYKGAALPPLPDAVAITMYRFVQEALTNVARHAEASRVDVVLGCENNVLTVSIADDGLGFLLQEQLSAPNWTAGVGLIGMQERLKMLDGRLEIKTKPGQGTRLVASVQLKSDYEQSLDVMVGQASESNYE